jgi:DNA primase
LLSAELGVDVLDTVTNIFGIDGELVVDEYICLCPDPKHADTNPSCGINVNTGLWNCWSCGANGDIITLGMVVLRKGYLKIRKLLSPEGMDGRRALLQNRLRALQKASGAFVAETPPGERPWLPDDAREPDSYRSGAADLEEYLYERGFEPETLQAWGIRYVRVADIRTKRGTAEIRNSIAIPLLDQDGTVQAWSYRSTPSSLDWQPRYLDTSDAPLGRYWHGMHLAGSYTQVYVCEGPLDAMKVWQAGFRPSLSIMGNQLPPEKVRMLADFRKVVLFLDRDAGGELATRKIGELLWRHTSLWVARYPTKTAGDDPGELAPVDIELAIAGSIPWTAWALRAKLASPTAT